MNTQELPNITADFLLAATTPELRAQMFVACACTNDMAGLDKLLLADDGLVARAGDNALAGACAKGHLAIVQHLHVLGVRLDSAMVWPVDVDATTAQFPLHEALSNQQWDVARWLLDNGANMAQVSLPPVNVAQGAPDLLYLMIDVGTWTLEQLKAALQLIAKNDDAESAQAVLKANLAHRLYPEAVSQHACAVMRALLESGHRPHVDKLDQHLFELEDEAAESAKAAQMRDIVLAYLHDDNHLQFDAQQLAHYRARLNTHDQRAEAAIMLTRAGEFMRSVVPLMITQNGDFMHMQDRRGFELSRILHIRGELMQVFSPLVWQGNRSAAMAFYNGMRKDLQDAFDLGAISAAFTTYHLPRGGARFKLAGGGEP